MSRVHRSLVWAVSSMCRAHMHTVRKYFQKVQKMLNLSIPPKASLLLLLYCHRSHKNCISKVHNYFFAEHFAHFVRSNISVCAITCSVIFFVCVDIQAKVNTQKSVAKLKWTSSSSICRFSQWEITRVFRDDKQTICTMNCLHFPFYIF